MKFTIKEFLKNQFYANQRSIELEKFEIHEKIGEGSTSEVFRITSRSTSESFALKVISKSKIQRNNLKTQIYTEKLILSKIKSPKFIKLFSTFQDATCLYFQLELAQKGSLLSLLNIKGGKLTDRQIKSTIYQIIEILEDLQNFGIVHQDLKPGNILVDTNNNLKLSDFGVCAVLHVAGINDDLFKQFENIQNQYSSVRSSISTVSSINNDPMTPINETKSETENDALELNAHKPDEPETEKTSFFANIDNSENFEKLTDENLLWLVCSHQLVGTLEYLSPETVMGNPPQFSNDVWALGVIAYQLLTNELMIHNKTETEIYKIIFSKQVGFNVNLSILNQSFISDLLQKKISNRLGCRLQNKQQNFVELKNHPFFADLFLELPNKSDGLQIDKNDNSVFFKCKAIKNRMFLKNEKIIIVFKKERLEIFDDRNFLLFSFAPTEIIKITFKSKEHLILTTTQKSFDLNLLDFSSEVFVDAISKLKS